MKAQVNERPAHGLPRRFLTAVGALLLTAPVVLSAVPASAATVAESEPNNTRATADVVAPGNTIQGAGSTVSDSLGDADYFAVDLPSAGRVALNLTFPSGLGTAKAYDLDVYDASGALLFAFDVQASSSDGSWLASQATFLPAGRFYVEIYTRTSSPAWGKQYSFKPVFTAGSVETEQNHTTAKADVVGVGASIAGSSLTVSDSLGDADYFAVDLPAAATVALSLTFPSGLGTAKVYDVTVYGSTGNQLYDFDVTGSQGDGAWLSSQLMPLPAGRFYVEIYGRTGSPTWGKQYTLSPLTPDTRPVYRFWSPRFNNAHFFTMNAAEAEQVRSTDRNWVDEGRAFAAYPLDSSGNCPKGSPVYRFWSPGFASHFYTQSVAERDHIIANDRNWVFEGANYCAPTTQEAGTVPLYRFWSPGFGKHFFTANQAEADHIRANDRNWVYESIAYYVMP